MFIAAPGHVLYARDFSGIEAKLVAYFANAKDLYRLTEIDVHGFLASHAIGRPAELSWSDSDLHAYFNDLKARKDLWETAGLAEKRPFKVIRQACKRALYLSMYLGAAKRMYEVEPSTFGSVKNAQWYQDLLFSTFPEIPIWHNRTCEEAERRGYLTAPSGFRLHYPNGVYEYVFDKANGKWERRMGNVAKEAIAARPQHTAMTFSARALIKAYQDPNLREALRLSIHDEILCEVPIDSVGEIDVELKTLMELPDTTMPLPPEWNQGEFVWVGTEAKMGERWSAMR
jgi:DNA polymerase I-like protein with 3'-5' exonuclease and polymerase domains